MKALNVAFVWHMHQPYYKDDLTSTYLLPWVRLRSAKDYFKMPALLDGYPKVRATFNLVPSLLAQIEDYGKEESVDLFLNLSQRAAGDLSTEERDFVLRWMRESPRALRVQQSPRYLELASRALDAQFTMADIRDLQVWFNLAWCDPVWVENDRGLAELKRKDRDFTEQDKAILFAAQAERIRSVIPKYRELAERGQAELTFSPYYHPILPLICHVDSARSANPQIQLPERHFSHREDAERQIELGMGLFERRDRARAPDQSRAGRPRLPGRDRTRRGERMGVLPAGRTRFPQRAVHRARIERRHRHDHGLRLPRGAPSTAAAPPPAHGQLDRRQPRHVDRRPRAQHRVGPARRTARRARSAVAAEAEGVAAGRARGARDPDHRGQRLVLVVQPQARLGHGPDLGQPVSPAPAQRLQADGRSRARPPVPADHQARAHSRAGHPFDVDQSPVASRPCVG